MTVVRLKTRKNKKNGGQAVKISAKKMILRQNLVKVVVECISGKIERLIQKKQKTKEYFCCSKLGHKKV